MASHPIPLGNGLLREADLNWSKRFVHPIPRDARDPGGADAACRAGEYRVPSAPEMLEYALSWNPTCVWQRDSSGPG